MFQPINVTLNYGRITQLPRSHHVAGGEVVVGWGVRAGRTNTRQCACRIAMILADNPLWDSGWVETFEPFLRCKPALPQGRRIPFRLWLRDDQGLESLPYESYLYNADVQWDASWIGLDDALDETCVYLRRSFVIDKPVHTASLYACGLGYHRLMLDGHPLDSAQLDPVVTDYRKECGYGMLPGLEALLTPGEHVLSAVLAAGWRFSPGVTRFLNENPSFFGPKQFSAMLRLDYADRSRDVLRTDDTWQAGRGGHVFASVFDGATYDARQERPGWNLCGYKDDGFTPACVLDAPGGVMRPVLIPPIVEGATRAPIACWPAEGNAVVLDFGQNLAGVLCVPLPAALSAGQRIEVMHAEELTEDGVPFQDTLRGAKATDCYIASGDSRDLAVWQSEFTYHGFRYAMIRGLDATFDPQRVRAVELHTALELRSVFRCGDALVTRIHEMCIQTERGNMHGILTDCPQRDERMQWLNDATVRFEGMAYNFDMGRMFPKVVRDCMQAQRSDGAISCTAPFVYGSIPADPVCSSFLLAGYEAMMHTGNCDILREAYPAFEAWERFLLSRSEGYIVDYSYYGDWAGPAYACVQPPRGKVPGVVSAVTPGVFISTGYSYLNCVLLAQFADWLGMPKRALAHRETAAQIRQAMLNRWYDKERAVMATGSQGCQAFSLWLDILPEADRPRAARHMRNDLVGSAYRITTGNLCTRYLMDTLTRFGYIEDAWALITRQTYPSLGFMLQQEATTVWERFELMKDSTMNSHNHPMYAAIDSWMYRHLIGVRPTAPGWTQLEVCPALPKELMSAQATVDTVRGEVFVRWFRRYGQATLHLNVPSGVSAQVRFGGETHRIGGGFHTFHIEAPDQASREGEWIHEDDQG